MYKYLPHFLFRVCILLKSKCTDKELYPYSRSEQTLHSESGPEETFSSYNNTKHHNGTGERQRCPAGEPLRRQEGPLTPSTVGIAGRHDARHDGMNYGRARHPTLHLQIILVSHCPPGHFIFHQHCKHVVNASSIALLLNVLITHHL